MNTNFDERQAFEDLRGVLNNMNNFANHYFAEMQKAQQLNAAKDSEIANLIAAHEKNIDALKNSYQEKIYALEKDLSAEREKVFAQEKNFSAQLQEYKTSNDEVTFQLKNFQETLRSEKASLDNRANELKEKERELEDASAKLTEKQEKFEAEKEMHKLQETPAEPAPNFDEERNSFNKEIDQLKNDLQTQKEEYEQKILNLNKEIADLKKVIEDNTKEDTPPAPEVINIPDSENDFKNYEQNNGAGQF